MQYKSYKKREKEKEKELSVLVTSDFVTEGHPDKLADKISDRVLDEIMRVDKNARVSCNAMGTGNTWFVGGEVTADLERKENGIRKAVKKGMTSFKASIHTTKKLETLIDFREQLLDSGYTDEDFDTDEGANEIIKQASLEQIVLDAIQDVYTSVGYSQEYIENLDIIVSIQEQSSDVLTENKGVEDQSIVIGYATEETGDYMPVAYSLARSLVEQLEMVRKENIVEGLLPDGKVQLTFDIGTMKVHSVSISTQHVPEWEEDIEGLQESILTAVIEPILGDLLTDETYIYINNTGKFVTGGIEGTSGLTGRKIMVDTYGTAVEHGGGAFSGKDATKLARSGSYMARYIAKNIVASYEEVSDAKVEITYIIGKEDNATLKITGKGINEELAHVLEEELATSLDFSPQAIINLFNLDEIRYETLATGGHFGREGYGWEELNLFT